MRKDELDDDPIDLAARLPDKSWLLALASQRQSDRHLVRKGPILRLMCTHFYCLDGMF